MKRMEKGKSGDFAEPVRKLPPILYALRKRRYDLNISSDVLAARIGVPRATLRKWETGVHSPNYALLVAWAVSLNMSLTISPNE